MVNDKQTSQTSNFFNFKPVIEEQFFMSKTGRSEDCEDSIHIGNHFIAAIDGATSKSIRKWNGETSGRAAAQMINEVFSRLPRDATVRYAADLMTSAIRNFYVQRNVMEIVEVDPVQRLTVSFVAVSLWRREVWLIGDCQCLLNEERISHDKMVDRIASEARALFLQSELLRGTKAEELEENDLGREYILPLLERMTLFQNNPSAGEYWYPVVDGFPIPDEGMAVQKFPDDVKTIVLASDGYPFLKSSLEESENALREILLEDPLLCYKYKSTKGLHKGNVSFDDRSYVKFHIQEMA